MIPVCGIDTVVGAWVRYGRRMGGRMAGYQCVG